MEAMAFLAPAHNPPYVAAMRSFRRVVPGTPLVALFETAFFDSMGEAATTCAVPFEWREALGVRRYGFHGASHRAASEHVRAVAGPSVRHVSCHLGGSSSVAAIRDGVAVETSFGMSPQSGVPHNNRVGDLDVFAALYVMKQRGLGPDAMARVLASESGLAGISGLSGDVRDLEEAAAAGHARARLALDVFVHAVRHHLGACLVALGGIDVLTFSGGIGEHSASTRAAVCAGLDDLGISLDEAANAAAHGDARISSPASRVAVHVVPADEERIVARATAEVVAAARGALERDMAFESGAPISRTVVEQIVREAVQKRLGTGGGSPRGPALAVHASARHMHLCREDLDALFGTGHDLTPERPLYQEGQLRREGDGDADRAAQPAHPEPAHPGAAAQAVPDRAGVHRRDPPGPGQVPVRLSGNIDGTPGAFVMGPKGVVELKQGVIRAAIHVHMNPEEAAQYGVKQGDVMKLRVAGPASVVFERVHVRIDPSSRLNVHMDTDEANACALHVATDFELFR